MGVKLSLRLISSSWGSQALLPVRILESSPSLISSSFLARPKSGRQVRGDFSQSEAYAQIEFLGPGARGRRELRVRLRAVL